MRRPIALLAIALLVAACSGADDPDDGVDGVDAPSTVSPSTTGVREPDVTTTESATTAPRSSTESETTSADTTVPAPVPTTDPPVTPTRDFTEVDEIVATFVSERGLNGAGLIVVDESGIVHEGYWGDFGPERVSLVASSSKQITAGVLLHLQDQGLLDMNAPVADAVPWGAANPDITPAQLVSSRSGLVGLGPDPAYPPYLCQFLADAELEQCAETIFTTTDDDADQLPPDTEFRYGGAQWQVAGGIAEAVSGKTWAELIQEIYVEPCGLEALGYNNHFVTLSSGFDYPEQVDGDLSFLDPTENPNMEGGAHLTARDYAALLLMHLRDGRCGDVQVLSPEALQQMYTDQLAPFGGSSRPGGGYGMGWWIDRATGRLTDPGAYGAVPWLDLEDRYGAYLVIEQDSTTGNELAALLDDPVERAVVGS